MNLLFNSGNETSVRKSLGVLNIEEKDLKTVEKIGDLESGIEEFDIEIINELREDTKDKNDGETLARFLDN